MLAGAVTALAGAFSEQHCNFLINDGTASAADLEQVGEDVRARVRQQHDIELRWEVRRIGRVSGDQKQEGQAG